MSGGNIKEDILWITTRVIRSIFEDHLATARSKSAKTSFESKYQRQSTLIWGIIKDHLATNNILAKPIKGYPIAVEAYAQWLVSNSEIKEYMYANTMAT